VLADIDTHLGIIARKHQEFEASAQQYKASHVDQVDAQITQLQQANANAMKEIGDRNNKIAELQKGLIDARQSLNNGESSWQAIEMQLRSPLEQAKQLLGGVK
jgi:predicted  nucleic acid-binding Zn-ribbon protein